MYIQKLKCAHTEPDPVPSYAHTVPIEARKPHTCIWGQNGDSTAGCFNKATLITELNDHCIQRNLWPRWADQPCNATFGSWRADSDAWGKRNTLLNTCSFCPCTLALAPILPSPRTDCYIRGHTQSLPGRQRTRKPNTVIYFAGSTQCCGCNWDSGVADLARVSLAASVNISRFGCHQAFPAAFFHWLGSKAQVNRVCIDWFNFVPLRIYTHAISCIYWVEGGLLSTVEKLKINLELAIIIIKKKIELTKK